MASKLLSLRRLNALLKPHFLLPSSSSSSIHKSRAFLLEASRSVDVHSHFHYSHFLFASSSRSCCSRSPDLIAESHGPAAIDYSTILQEGEFHKLANKTVHDLQEKIEEYSDSIKIDGFDVEYGNEVLTVKLGSLGTYVLNKQTPNRQLWLSSPVSGPSRFDWDQDSGTWIYRRTKANLYKLLESELEQLCGEPIKLA
uniref:ferroxidase n=1 Tax=Rhizophora mucronata TaxID=61149 RepID=A0A2P2IQJ0_RHIMU